LANDAASNTIFPQIIGTSQPSSITPSTSKNTSAIKTKRKQKSSDQNLKPASYHLRFVPVDPIKHAPSIILASIETARLASQDFSLEFCARERSLPFAKMIHGRMLVSAIDYNISQVDPKAVFLLAEATICMLKNILTKLISRNKFKNKLRYLSVHDSYRSKHITDIRVLDKQNERLNRNIINEFKLDPSLINKLKNDDNEDIMIESEEDLKENYKDENELNELKNFSNDLNNQFLVPVKKQKITLFDLKNLLEISKSSLMPSHSIYTINMEKTICSMWHESDDSDSTEEDLISFQPSQQVIN
jgi:hypothetical protein